MARVRGYLTYEIFIHVNEIYQINNGHFAINRIFKSYEKIT